jgi:hypothetical protein
LHCGARRWRHERRAAWNYSKWLGDAAELGSSRERTARFVAPGGSRQLRLRPSETVVNAFPGQRATSLRGICCVAATQPHRAPGSLTMTLVAGDCEGAKCGPAWPHCLTQTRRKTCDRCILGNSCGLRAVQQHWRATESLGAMLRAKKSWLFAGYASCCWDRQWVDDACTDANSNASGRGTLRRLSARA